MEQSQYIKKRTSPILYVFFVLLIALAGYGLYVVVNGNKNKEDDKKNEEVVDNNNDQNQGEQNDNTNTPPQNEDNDTTPPVNPDNTNSETTDFSKYSTSQQNTGESTNKQEYALSSVTNSAGIGYHSFKFTLVSKTSSETDPEPYIVAKYVSSLGVIRMDLNGTTTDNSGIGYQKSVDINKEGVVRLYHNVSADQTEELYDIGVSKSTPFYLTIEPQNNSGNLAWDIILYVKYPGASDSSSIDLGSTEFSKDAQTIDGAGKVDGAKVSSYSYSASGGVLKVAFSVQGSASKPIPFATAGYDGDGKLILKFNDIASDVIAKMPASLAMSGGVTMSWEMDGSSASKYTFDGASKEFKLSATQSPNQVVIEIKL